MNEPTDARSQNSKCEELRNRTAERERSRRLRILDLRFRERELFPISCCFFAAGLRTNSERHLGIRNEMLENVFQNNDN